MSSKVSKGYEPVLRGSVFSSAPPPSKGRLIKLFAILVTILIGLSALHALLLPRHTVYGLMIDAGSTGSRIHTYYFRHHPVPGKLDLVHEDFYALKPGLSSHKDDPDEAAKSLVPLLERAMARIPKEARPATPVVLRATAGLRMVGEDAANAILGKVRTLLKESDFRFDSDDWATILAGNEEAVYSWVTVNYLLDRRPDDTVGTLEMGGGSAQIAYVPRDEPLETTSGNCSLRNEDVDFKGRDLPLYTVSHLDFGLQKARAIALDKFEETGKLSDNACINSGATVDMAVPFDDSGKKLTMSGNGDYTKCRQLVDENVILPAMGAACGCDVCTYRSAAQPRSIPEYVAIAFYLERTVSLGLSTPLTVKNIREKGEEVCAMSVDEVQAKYPQVPNGVATDLCFDLAFMTLHLERGHGIHESSDTKLMVLDKIRGVELGWCLGAMQQTMSTLGFGR